VAFSGFVPLPVALFLVDTLRVFPIYVPGAVIIVDTFIALVLILALLGWFRGFALHLDEFSVSAGIACACLVRLIFAQRTVDASRFRAGLAPDKPNAFGSTSFN